MHRNSPPLVFLSVCKRWRQIAKSSSALWSTLKVEADDLKDVRMMSRWLQFADEQPLSITLFASWNRRIADLAIDVLLERQAYWVQVDLHWCMPDCAPLLAHSFTSNNAPLLQRFSISTDLHERGKLENIVDAGLGKLLTGSTDLRTFEWSLQFTTAPESAIDLAGIPFNNLRHLKLGCCMAFPRCLDILNRTPLLESCDLIHVEYFDDPSMHATIQLPKLRSLCVKTDCPMDDFLDALTLPSLQRIEVAFRIYDTGELDDEDVEAAMFPGWPHAAFLSLLQRSACPLEELSLGTPVSADELLQYLPLVSPTLRTLSLGGTFWACVDHRVLAQLTVRPHSSVAVPCPKLRTLRLDACFVPALPQNAVADLVQSRLVHAAAAGDGVPMEVDLTADTGAVHDDDWRRLEVLRMRSAGKARMTITQLG
ncbi:hypothetical protein HWV62_34587 [Athelia sp. TMB]|nr:hypothetical protein HWV62_34587 [Athelia sp. TMB]